MRLLPNLGNNNACCTVLTMCRSEEAQVSMIHHSDAPDIAEITRLLPDATLNNSPHGARRQ
eukprot:3131524-Alexandrium_andersonii.AAC.1